MYTYLMRMSLLNVVVPVKDTAVMEQILSCLGLQSGITSSEAKCYKSISEKKFWWTMSDA